MIHELVGIQDNRVDLRTREEKDKKVMPLNADNINVKTILRLFKNIV